MVKGNSRFKYSNKVIHLIFFVVCAFSLLPLLLVIMSSVSRENDVAKYGYSLIPRHFSAEAYKTIFKDPSFIFNSYAITILVTLCGTVFGILLITLVAYPMSRKDYKYKNKLSFYVFFTMLFNGGLVPSYILISNWLHMKNTVFALFVPTLVNAFYVLMMKGFLQTIPNAIYESAKIDGIREFTMFFKIVIPLSKPAIATVALFLTLQFWNDWFMCMLYIDNRNLFTLQYQLTQLQAFIEFFNQMVISGSSSGLKVDMPVLTSRMAMCVVTAGPMLCAFPFFQKYFVRGLVLGSVKG